jgi:hypothetical protein
MGEPLLDHNSILVVVLGCFAVLLLRCQTTVSSRGNQPTPLRLLANILLGFAAWMLSVRWMNTQASIAADSRPSLWLSSLLSVACGLSVFFAVKTVVAESLAWRIRHFCATLAGCAAALFSVAFWLWGALLITLSVSVFVLFLRRPKPIAMLGLRRILRGEPRESGLVTMTGAALLLVLLGSWQHVFDHEIQRQTRSPRFSAWPRASALRDAWERTGWIASPRDESSGNRVAVVSAQEQRVAWGLGSLLMLLSFVAWRDFQEGDHSWEPEDAV